MKLKFLGRGSAFNIAEGNTSAYYKNQSNNMLLIDCGETVFSTIKTHQVLNNVEQLFIVITHTHCDHIGSLGSLVLFNFYARKQKAKLVLSGKSDLDMLVKQSLLISGVSEQHIDFVTVADMLVAFPEFESFEYEQCRHVAEIPCYGFIIKHKTDGITYYTADTNDGSNLQALIASGKPIDAIYVDTCKADYEGNVHLSARVLCELVQPQNRHLCHCMHLDDAAFEPNLIEMGFNVVNHRSDLGLE